MKFGSPKLWISILSFAGVLFFVLVDVGRSAPGPLAAVHARHPDLTGFRSCAQCHGGWTAGMAESCLECHQDIADQIEKSHGLHGTVSAATVQQCGTCHSDHNGEGFQMVNRRSFQVAGIPDLQKFDHRRIGFAMEGRHAELACEECHKSATVEVLPEGTKRFLGLSQDCKTCHTDPHEGRMGLSCASCHTQAAFEKAQAADHDKHLQLTGPHGGLACRDCHAADTPHALENMGRRGPRRPKARLCADCHESPHAEAFITNLAAQVRQPPAGSCATCHTAEHLTFRDETLLMTKEHHAATGFALDKPHTQVTCNQCHGGDDDAFAARHPGRKANDCRSCHQDPHGGQFDHGPFQDKGCIACHDREHFAPHAFDVRKHDRTRFPLTGRHAKQECNACHSRPDPTRPRQFHGTRSDCASCHQDAHEGFFRGFRKTLDPDGRGTCAACHSTESFAERSATGFDHGRFAGFPLRGAHAQLECEECHRPMPEPDATGRRFGRITGRQNQRGQPPEPVGKAGQSCRTCHRDPHQGGFDVKGLPAEVDGRNGCERCHSHDSFRTLPHSFDHQKWTGFALSGAHGKARCSDCHQPLRRADGTGRTWGRAKGSSCADCHADPHGGQFARRKPGAKSPSTDCAQCHRTSTDFHNLSFNHDLQSRFPLGERHKGVACARCHQSIQSKGKTLVRYRPMARTCAACHGRQQSPLRRRGGTKR